MADQVRDEQHLSMSMFVNPADYWQAMYERRETEAHQLSEQIIRLRASHAAEVEALRAFFRDVAELTMDHDRIELPGGDYAVVYPNKLGQALAKVDPNWTRAALKGEKP